MDILKKKLKGVSILESLVAMSIILLTLTLSAGVYAGVSGNKKGLKTVFFQNECETIYNELKKEANPESKTVSTESYNYEATLKPYMDSKELLEATIVVFEKGESKKLFEYKRLFISEADAPAF
jgi:hypothetical protein